MAIRASSSSAIRAAKTEGAPRATATRTLQLDLSTVLAPYKKKHIALRIERIPQRARLSAGRKNGDNSWSLTREDTNDLEYLLPEEVATAHTLAIRIMDLDAAGGSTLALVEYKVKVDDAAPAASEEDGVADVLEQSSAGDEEIARLRDELAKLKEAPQQTQRDLGADAKLTAAQVEISHLRKQLNAANAREAAAAEQQEHEIATHLAEARAEFAAELERRMAATTGTTASEIQRHRTAWQAEFATTQEQWRQEAGEREAAAEQRWKQQAEKSLADAEQAWKQQSQKALADAEQNWKVEEAKRLAAREAEWQAQTAKALADAHNTADGARNEAHGTEVETLKQKVAALEASLADRDVVLAESQKAAESAQTESARELKDALAKAEQDWKDAETKRLAALEAEWQAKLQAAAKADLPPPPPAPDKAKEEELKKLRAEIAEFPVTLAKAEQTWKDAEAKRVTTLEDAWKAKLDAANEAARKAPPPPPSAPSNDEELKELRAQAAQFKTTLADYEAAMAQAQKAAVEAQANTDKKVVDALAAKDAEWQAKLKVAVDKARSDVPPPVVTADAPPADDEVKALREQVAELETTLIDRDATIERLETEAAEPKTPTSAELKDELVKAERLWKAGEAERITAAQQQARLDQQRELHDAVARFEQAEAALAHMRIRASDDNRAHNEVTTLRASLGVREREIVDLRKQLDDARGYVSPEEGGDVSAAGQEAKEQPVAEPINQMQRYTRDAMVAAAAGVLIVIGYTFFGDLVMPQTPAPHPAEPVVAAVAPKPVVELPKSLIAKSAKLRANAEANAETVARLPVDSEVTVLERKDTWTRVRYQANAKSQAQEGWVYTSVLKEKPAAPDAKTQKAK